MQACMQIASIYPFFCNHPCITWYSLRASKKQQEKEQNHLKSKLPFFDKKFKSLASSTTEDGQLYGTLNKKQKFPNPQSQILSHHQPGQQQQPKSQQQFASLQPPSRTGSIQRIQEPIYSNNMVLNQQKMDARLHQTASLLSLTASQNQSQKTSSPYVMYSLDPTIHYPEDSSMNPMSNFAQRRVSNATSGSTQSIYSQLQFPSTSNFGSMKRKKKGDSSSKKNSVKEEVHYSTDSTEYSTDATGDNIDFTEQEYTDNNVKIWSLQYVPQVFSISKKTVKV